MSYIVAKNIDNDKWDDVINWMRNWKSLGIKGILISNDLSKVSKASELGFEIVVPNKEHSDIRDDYLAIVSKLDKKTRCLYVNDFIIRSSLPEDVDVTCSSSTEKDIYNFISPIRSLTDRVKAYDQLETILNKYSHFFSLNPFILGTWEFWNEFSSLGNYVSDRNYFDKYSNDLFFNLYISLTSNTIKIN